MEGYLSLNLEYLKATIAASARFRTVTGSADVDEAKTHIHRGRAYPAQTKPRAIIRHLAEDDYKRLSNTGFRPAGQMLMVFEFPIAAENQGDDKYEAAYEAFTDDVGIVIEEMAAAVTQTPGGLLNITRIETTVIGQADPKEHGNEQFWIAEQLVHYR